MMENGASMANNYQFRNGWAIWDSDKNASNVRLLFYK